MDLQISQFSAWSSDVIDKRKIRVKSGVLTEVINNVPHEANTLHLKVSSLLF